MSSEIQIRTKRLTLRALTPDDGGQIVDLLNDFEVSRWLTVVPHPYGEKDFAAFMAHLKDRSSMAALAIEHDQQVLGVVGCDGGLGYWLGQAHHGRGVMSEAAGALVDHVFATQPGRDTIASGHFRGNTASQRVLHKLGFQETGEVETVHCVAQAIDVELIKLSLTRADRSTSQ